MREKPPGCTATWARERARRKAREVRENREEIRFAEAAT
ncbi:hypothetical protein APASM_0253 [Actinosynnema pretiosum subsp. pretiosum]|nr:hypothetical protein APASM_0253 [Actinosynnema pretiosum subsp. pretiosum]